MFQEQKIVSGEASVIKHATGDNTRFLTPKAALGFSVPSVSVSRAAICSAFPLLCFPQELVSSLLLLYYTASSDNPLFLAEKCHVLSAKSHMFHVPLAISGTEKCAYVIPPKKKDHSA